MDSGSVACGVPGLGVIQASRGEWLGVTDSQIRNTLRLIEFGEPATQVARDLGMPRTILCRRIRELPFTVG